MTVCIAALFTWFYGDGDYGRAIITASDRMLTAGDIQYEPSQLKVSHLNNTTMLMVAGDMAIHTEALSSTKKDINEIISPTVQEIANIYAEHLRNIRRRRAIVLYLEPLGLDETSFLANQRTMLPQVVVDLSNELRTYTISVEALVVGCEGNNDAHIYQIDAEGIVTHHDDINFAAIGAGSGQAKSYLMFSRYPRLLAYFRALPLLYGAKRRAEAAPGVGIETDYFLIRREGAVLVDKSYIKIIESQYLEEEKRKSADSDILETRLIENATELARALAPPTVISSADSSGESETPKQSGQAPPQEGLGA